jgi:nucleotide-binding universal stress UspA family protein
MFWWNLCMISIADPQVELESAQSRWGIRRVMVGSVAEEAIHQAPCPCW